MILPTFVIAFGVAVVLLYRYLARRRDESTLWPSALGIGLVVGVTRAVLATGGWYVVEHTGGPLQVPAYLLVMFALPEAAIFRGHRGPASPEFLLLLAGVLIVTSVLTVSAVALLVGATRGAGRAARASGR
jgi:hypothetical protein